MTDEKETPEVDETEAEAEAAEEVAEAKAEPPTEKRYTRRQLEHMTAKRLRDLALDLKEIAGVHGMKKGELVEAIFTLRGVEEAEGVSAFAVDKGAIKQEIRQLKGLRTSALEAGDSNELKRVRNRIKRLKRTLRKVS
ncbi:MAG: transcription termination factor Rho [Nitrospinae bacterium]|nr:transcription termination factor Rho [Nitrospinota bacterium]